MIKILILAIFFPVTCFCQKIKAVEYDKFTNQRRIETEELLILNSPAKWPHLSISLRSVDTFCFITLHGENIASGIIGPADIAYILLDDNSKVTVYSTGLQTTNSNMGGTNNYYVHQYRISLADVQRLTEKKIISIRRYYNSSYGDIDIVDEKEKSKKVIERAEKHSDDARELATVFYKELSKR